MPMRGLPDNSQLLHSHDITPAAYDTPDGRNCALHQLSELLTLDCQVLTDPFRDLFTEVYGECADLDFVTPALVIRYARENDFSC